MEIRRRASGAFQRARHQHAADTRNEPRRGNYACSRRRREALRWGDKLEFVAEAGPGDFIYVPPYVPHQEINASDTEPLSCVLCRSGQEPVVVNLPDLPVAEKPEEVRWVDDIHKK